jgi:hypothetical protein
MKFVNILMVIYGVIFGYLVYALEFGAAITVIASVFVIDRYIKSKSFRDKINLWI